MSSGGSSVFVEIRHFQPPRREANTNTDVSAPPVEPPPRLHRSFPISVTLRRRGRRRWRLEDGGESARRPQISAQRRGTAV